ncbi:hypothetical protein F511_11685 [Dorcoceras hygrometricum]|uniref:Uncharacterized protein n=1 Tax=Dorcoceras hygrometricum TaxID=472368 RepID=A0A2Z7C6I6_9LAMI|nr:hypothetical protein F511_11685 [Dorcoceras hygrometricum]
MAMGTQRSSALHNFTFPVGLRWGNQRFLRCIKVDSHAQVSPPLSQFTANDADASDHHHHKQQSFDKRRSTGDGGRDQDSIASKFLPFGSLQIGSAQPPVSDGGRRISEVEDGGFAAMREKAIVHVQTAAEKSKAVTFEDGRKSGAVSASLPPHPPLPPHSAVLPCEGESKKPWNLRKRRAACKTPGSGLVFGNGGSSAAGISGKALRAEGAEELTGELASLRSGGNVVAICGEKLMREKFSVALSKSEIVEDFLAFTGHKPARRPKKRAKIVQRELDALFPGLNLTDITADMYKVSEGAP